MFQKRMQKIMILRQKERSLKHPFQTGVSANARIALSHANDLDLKIGAETTLLTPSQGDPNRLNISHSSPNLVDSAVDLVTHLFHGILYEKRLSATVRLLFLRLQVAVMREVIADPCGFTVNIHPARTLVALMNSCAMGFDGAMVSGTDLENEIERVMQFLEQSFPAGRLVFEQACLIFQKFLSGFQMPIQSQPDDLIASLQKERREAYVLIHDMLQGLSVHSEVKNFLFSVWSDVLALTKIYHGPDHANTLAMQNVVNGLIWTSGAKKTRRSRARVISDVSLLLKQMRTGMTLIGLSLDQQKHYIDAISPSMIDAFLSVCTHSPSDKVNPSKPVALDMPVKSQPQAAYMVNDPGVNGLMVTEIDEPSDTDWAMFEKSMDHPTELDDKSAEFPEHLLDKYPSIKANIIGLWGTVKLSNYLSLIFENNRDQVRSGFPLDVTALLLKIYHENIKFLESKNIQTDDSSLITQLKWNLPKNF